MLSPSARRGLKRMWCCGEDFMPGANYSAASASLGWAACGEHLADQPEGPPMERRRPQFAQGAAMILSRITAVPFPPVTGVISRMRSHDPVACHLGDDRGGGDRAASRITRHDRLGRAIPSRAAIAVDEHEGRVEPERFDRPGHRQHPRPIDVERVDLLDTADSDPAARLPHQLGMKRLARFEIELLAIVDPARKMIAVEDHGRSDHRSRQRSAASLVDAGQRQRMILSRA